MSLEEEIFKKSHPSFEKLLEYGFSKEENGYRYEPLMTNSHFQVQVLVLETGKVIGKIMDLMTEEEYTQYRHQNSMGEFASRIKEEYISLLNDIQLKCFDIQYFVYNQSNRVAYFIKKKYGVVPEFLWKNSPNHGVFRNPKNNKWFGIIMYIERKKLEKSKNGFVEVLNVKLDNEVEEYLKKEYIYVCYHMSKKNWVSIILDESVCDTEIQMLIEKSYQNAS